MNKKEQVDEKGLDFTSKKEFFEYYAKQSLSEESFQRIVNIHRMLIQKLEDKNKKTDSLNVVDVGCGAGAMSLFWAKHGHKVHGIDVNEPLIQLGKDRADEENLVIDFKLGTATNLPWDNHSMDVCLVPELLEHVVDWEGCLNEFARVLKPDGVLFLSTNNKLCPKQQEYNLPLYSWYPGFIKQYCVKLALTTHPEIAGYATYPAVNWFTFFQLKKRLKSYGMESFDRFDLIDISKKGILFKYIIKFIRNNDILRRLAHVFTPYTIIVAIKNNI